jgi:hypothetical protein
MDPAKVARHKLLIRANQNADVAVVYGQFKRKDKCWRLCEKEFQTFEEKQADVNIALELFRLADLDKDDRAVIVSGDTDLISAIKAVHATFSQKQIVVLIPIGKSSEDLLKHADFRFKMREQHLSTSGGVMSKITIAFASFVAGVLTSLFLLSRSQASILAQAASQAPPKQNPPSMPGLVGGPGASSVPPIAQRLERFSVIGNNYAERSDNKNSGHKRASERKLRNPKVRFD